MEIHFWKTASGSWLPASGNPQDLTKRQARIKRNPQPSHAMFPGWPVRSTPGTAAAGRNPGCPASPGAAPARLDGTAVRLRPGTHTASAAPSVLEHADADKSLPQLLRSECTAPGQEISPW